MTPEFSRPIRIDTIGEGERSETIEASDTERAALAQRFGLLGIERLSGNFVLRRDAAGVLVSGRVLATATQACSITGESLPAAVDEEARLRFVDDLGGGEEVELDDADIDVLPLEGAAIDLGEVAAETLALSLDPFPRGPNAEAALKEAGVLSEGEAGPFGALAGLKEKLARK
ncbi:MULTISPECIES: YceD family protein [unclassified Sphingomonas]|uniref:YceD family protein n=1 Tax=unclassified Sphingomonas TaxID=196159 RepID=UPI001D129F18|nr:MULTISPECIES: DUF177 domain-containing protein [unclassified Sphingomonas]MCC2980503.1 DUF177 domain-containing protein [Sphingomonas sp. IC4-52]MCD2316398.1 DUF177 domain-containing protein [Sphingomonas sp. IC-11]